jgi:hypothetical protein
LLLFLTPVIFAAIAKVYFSYSGFFIGEIYMPLALRSFFIVGVYDPVIYGSWPYFHLDEGVYLSKNKRLCSFNSAIEFDNPDDARVFYASWRHADRYRLFIRDYQTHVEVPMPVFPDDHPRSILMRIQNSAPRYVFNTALKWFIGDSNYFLAKSTLAKHRKILLAYGIDINCKPNAFLEPFPNLHEKPYSSKPTLSVI